MPFLWQCLLWNPKVNPKDGDIISTYFWVTPGKKLESLGKICKGGQVGPQNIICGLCSDILALPSSSASVQPMMPWWPVTTPQGVTTHSGTQSWPRSSWFMPRNNPERCVTWHGLRVHSSQILETSLLPCAVFRFSPFLAGSWSKT